MAWAYYKREQEYYDDDFRAHLPLYNKERIKTFVETVCNHFKVVTPGITFNGVRWHRCLWDPPRLNFIENMITLRFLAHELAHHVENQLTRNRKHNKLFARRVESIMVYLYDFVLTKEDKLGVHSINRREDDGKT